MPERNPIAHLQEQWEQLDPPSAVRPLGMEDLQTQEVVAWMECGWNQIQIPEASLPRRNPLLRMRFLSMAAAAALLVSALVFWSAEKALNQDTIIPSLAASAPAKSPQPGSQPPLARPKLITNNPSQVQFLSGNVRLTLLRGSATSLNTSTTDS